MVRAATAVSSSSDQHKWPGEGREQAWSDTASDSVSTLKAERSEPVGRPDVGCQEEESKRLQGSWPEQTRR